MNGFGRKYFFLFLFLASRLVWAQKINNHWSIDFSFGLEAHDKRLFDWPHPDIYLNEVPEYFGTYKYRMGITYRLGKDKLFNQYVGIGASTNYYTMYRPISRVAFQDPPYQLDITSTKNYKINSADLQYTNAIRINNLVIESAIQTEFSFVKTALRVPFINIKLGPRFEPQLYALSWYGGIGYRFKNYSLSLRTRILYYRQYDPAIFSGIFKAKIGIYPPYYYHWGEWYNPVNLTFNLNYSINPEKIKADQIIHKNKMVLDTSYRFLEHFSITLGAGIEAHDKRLFEIVNKDEFLSRSTELFGTYHLRVGALYKFKKINKWTQAAGIAYSWNRANFYRLATNSELDLIDPSPELYRFTTDHYTIRAIDGYWQTQFDISKKVYLKSQMRATFSFAKWALIDKSDLKIGYSWNPEVYAFSWHTGIGYDFPYFSLSLLYRLLYHQKYDIPIIAPLFDHINYRNNPYNKRWGDWYNPVHLTLEISVPLAREIVF